MLSEDNSNVIMWEDIWNDVTPGSEAGIKQHMSEISAVLESALNSPSWTMKAQVGFSLIKFKVLRIGIIFINAYILFSKGWTLHVNNRQ